MSLLCSCNKAAFCEFARSVTGLHGVVRKEYEFETSGRDVNSCGDG